MQLGVVNFETWSFFREIYDDLEKNHSVSRFEWQVKPFPILNQRLNEWSLNRSLHTFLDNHDVVFFEWASDFLLVASHLPKRCGVVTRLHRYEMYGVVDQINWNSVDKIILVSQVKKKEFLERFPDQASKLIVIPEAIDPEAFPFRSKPFTGKIGILCHLTPRKRVYELILSFYDLSQRNKDLTLHIGGGQQPEHLDYYIAIRNLVKELDLESKVTFYGHVNHPAEWYQAIDIFISNSYSEGLQVAPMEAMASGCYCLAHHWEGAEELLPQQYLYYTDAQLQRKILDYCVLPEKEKQKEQECMRDLVYTHFNVHDTKVQIRRVIESVGAAYQKYS